MLPGSISVINFLTVIPQLKTRIVPMLIQECDSLLISVSFGTGDKDTTAI